MPANSIFAVTTRKDSIGAAGRKAPVPASLLPKRRSSETTPPTQQYLTKAALHRQRFTETMTNTTDKILDDDALGKISDVLDQGVQPLYVESGGWEEIWITCKLDAAICFAYSSSLN